MTIRCAALVVSGCLCPLLAFAQAAPSLTRQQRELLQAVVTAVDAAATQPASADLEWQSHVMRTSDGSHYVAFSIAPPAASALPAGPVLLYVRLATSSEGAAQRIVERSAVREWLVGNRTDPRLLPKRGIVIGEMPMMGAAGLNTVRPPTSTGSNEMRLMAKEREQAKQEQEERDKKRRAELEGRVAPARDILPFEDFDLASHSTLDDGTRIITRALTAGPGDYDLYVGWGDPAAAKPAASVRVLRTPLKLLAARTAGLETSSIILAQRVTLRPAPYSPAEQASHPYSIGVMEIVPARAPRYRREDSLSVAFQVINAQSTDAGMPDVNVSFRIVRMTGEREAPVASLNPQTYNATTLPADFNVRLGHPLFAAVTAPLATLARGDYRLKIVVHDRLANGNAFSDADFSVIGTPASLLAEAPPVAPPFRREAALGPQTLAAVVDALSPAMPSPALARALAVARTDKLVDLLVEEPVPAPEAGIRTALTALALLSIGDTSAAVQFQRALQQNAPAAPVQFLLGAARAMQSRDPDAIAAWQAALAAGPAPAITAPLLVDAYLRRNDVQRATELIAASGGATSPQWTRASAATLIAGRREADAVALLERHLAAQPADQDARWLVLHAAYALWVRDRAAAAALREPFRSHARIYIDANAANAALAAEWLKVIS